MASKLLAVPCEPCVLAVNSERIDLQRSLIQSLIGVQLVRPLFKNKLQYIVTNATLESRNTTMKHFKTILLLTLIGVITFLSVKIYSIETERRLLKEDLIELSKIKYGIFSVDEWKKILTNIITKKVQDLNFSGENRTEMRKKISTLLYKVIDEYEARYYEQNAKSFSGILKNALTTSFGAFKDIRKNVPTFTENIMDFLNDPKNKKALREYIISKLNEYADNTFSKIDYSEHDAVIKKYSYENREKAIDGLTASIDGLTEQSKPYKISILVMAMAMIVSVFLMKSFTKAEYVLLVTISLLLLITGLLLPMIEIDARISKMSFTMLGESITFNDQVLYYKSKSILEVVWLMFKQSRVDVMIVGVLVLVFSVLFPLMKQVASLIFVFSKRMRTNRVIGFMVFKTGKWSMADVMVVAIFMSYIGFFRNHHGAAQSD
jgi:fumarate reductase subunit D